MIPFALDKLKEKEKRIKQKACQGKVNLNITDESKKNEKGRGEKGGGGFSIAYL